MNVLIELKLCFVYLGTTYFYIIMDVWMFADCLQEDLSYFVTYYLFQNIGSFFNFLSHLPAVQKHFSSQVFAQSYYLECQMVYSIF